MALRRSVFVAPLKFLFKGARPAGNTIRSSPVSELPSTTLVVADANIRVLTRTTVLVLPHFMSKSLPDDLYQPRFDATNRCLPCDLYHKETQTLSLLNTNLNYSRVTLKRLDHARNGWIMNGLADSPSKELDLISANVPERKSRPYYQRGS